MTSGTSQGLFIVVAIVIFGLFVGLAYTAFGSEGGLSNDLENLFKDSTKQAEENLFNKDHINYFPDEGFEEDDTLYENFTARGGTSIAVDKKHRYEGKNTLYHNYIEAGSQYKYKDDVVLWMTDARFKDVIVDDTLTISFNAKALDEVELTGRLGANFEINTYGGGTKEDLLGLGLKTVTITEDWKRYELVFDVVMSQNSGYGVPAFVYWLDGPGEMWLSDLRIEIGKEYVD